MSVVARAWFANVFVASLQAITFERLHFFGLASKGSWGDNAAHVSLAIDRAWFPNILEALQCPPPTLELVVHRFGAVLASKGLWEFRGAHVIVALSRAWLAYVLATDLPVAASQTAIDLGIFRFWT